MTTSEPDAYVWAWLPGASEPVVAGALVRTERLVAGEPVLAYAYGRSYLERDDAISLFTPELPLTEGTKDPSDPQPGTAWRGYRPEGGRRPLPLAGCLRDAAPDAWGRRVINARLGSDPDTPLSELTYLLESGSDRIGALDFQTSSHHYVARARPATLDQLVHVAELVERAEPIPEDLAAAALAGRGRRRLRLDGRRQDTGGVGDVQRLPQRGRRHERHRPHVGGQLVPGGRRG